MMTHFCQFHLFHGLDSILQILNDTLVYILLHLLNASLHASLHHGLDSILQILNDTLVYILLHLLNKI